MASNINAMPAGEDEPLLQPKRKSMKSIVVTSLAVSLVLGACAATAIHSRNDVKVASLAKTIDGKSCLYYYQEEGDACTDPDDFDGMVCANDGDYDEMYCSFDFKNKKKACVRCQQYDKESKSYMIKGRKCKKKHVINDSLGDAKEITECEDPDDYEGMVCANDGADDEMYCSFDVGPYACARCADYEDAAVCNGQIDCGGNGPCPLGSFCNFDCGDGSYGDPSCGTCETCDDEYFTFMEQSCDSRGLPGSGVLDCHACCT